jgi:hemoglobin
MSSEHPTLHQSAGGDPAFRRLIDAFYDRVEGDDLLRASSPKVWARSIEPM